MTTQKRRTAERGYGGEHQARRKALIRQAIGDRCELCGYVMEVGQALDLDHKQPLALGGHALDSRIVHATCNRRRGQALGQALRARKRPQPTPVKRAQSREWTAPRADR